MAFRFTSETPPIFNDTQTDSEVARPGPQDSRVGERNIKMVTVMRQVGMPDRLGGHVCVWAIIAV